MTTEQRDNRNTGDALMRPRLGDRWFEVEWITNLPVDEFGDCVPDLATYDARYCETLDVARVLAKCKAAESVDGCAHITPVELVDPFGDGIPCTFIWESRGDTEYAFAEGSRV